MDIICNILRGKGDAEKPERLSGDLAGRLSIPIFYLFFNLEHICPKLRKMIFQFMLRINHLQRSGIHLHRFSCLHVFRLTHDKGSGIQSLKNRPKTMLRSWRNPWYGAHFLKFFLETRNRSFYSLRLWSRFLK